MPCELVTVQPPESSFQISSFNTTQVARGEISASYTVSETTGVGGQVDVEVTVDVKDDGSIDARETFSHDLSGGGSDSNQVNFTLDISEESDARVCANTL